MPLQYTGEVLAVTTRRVESRDGSFQPYDQSTVQCFDGKTTTELRLGRDFGMSQILDLQSAANERATVVFDVFVGNNGRLFAESVVGVKDAAK